MKLRVSTIAIVATIAVLFASLVAPAHAALQEVCQRNTRGSWSWGLRTTLTGDMFLYQGPVTSNANIRNAWCNTNAPVASPTPAFSLATVVIFPKTICHHTPSNNVTLTFQNQQSYNGHLGTPHNGSTYDTNGPCATATASPTASATASPSPSSSATASPTASPTADPSSSASPSPTADPTDSPTPAPTQSTESRTDLSDGRSDGKTDSLGCLKPSDNCNTQPTVVAGMFLPSTGGANYGMWIGVIAFAAILSLVGMKMNSKMSKEQKELESK
jgi:hypothetical protein